MLKGRKEPSVYIDFLMTFGGVYVKNKLPKRTTFCSAIAKGNKLCDLITTNTEAFMRTVLFVGCSKDWPRYLEGEEYRSWCRKTNTTEEVTNNDDNGTDTVGADGGDNSSTPKGRPVSVCDCFCPFQFCSCLNSLSFSPQTEMFFVVHKCKWQNGFHQARARVDNGRTPSIQEEPQKSQD